jgi:hypothetical protein
VRSNDDIVEALYDNPDTLDEMITATRAHNLGGVLAKAAIYRTLAFGDAELTQPLLRSLARDLCRVPCAARRCARTECTDCPTA